MALTKVGDLNIKYAVDGVNKALLEQDVINTANAAKFVTDEAKLAVVAGDAGVRTINTSTGTIVAGDSGKTILFGKADGCVLTLPVGVAGMRFKFVVNVSNTSNANKIIGAAATALFTGAVLVNGATDLGFVPGASDYAISMNGTTTGGLIGTQLDFLCISPTQWLVTGVVAGSGSLATPFAAS